MNLVDHSKGPAPTPATSFAPSGKWAAAFSNHWKSMGFDASGQGYFSKSSMVRMQAVASLVWLAMPSSPWARGRGQFERDFERHAVVVHADPEVHVEFCEIGVAPCDSRTLHAHAAGDELGRGDVLVEGQMIGPPLAPEYLEELFEIGFACGHFRHVRSSSRPGRSLGIYCTYLRRGGNGDARSAESPQISHVALLCNVAFASWRALPSKPPARDVCPWTLNPAPDGAGLT